MSESLGFLISDVSRLMRRRFDERARLIGVTRAQWRTLVTLSRHEGINQGGLADLLEVEPITLCRMVDRLEEAGLVERRRDPADRRAWQIFPPPQALPPLHQLRGPPPGPIPGGPPRLGPAPPNQPIHAPHGIPTHTASPVQ